MSMRHLFNFPFKALGSRCEIKLYTEDEATAQNAVQSALAELERIEKKYSRYLPDSLLSQLNQSAHAGWMELDAETVALFDYADQLYQLSAGAFDITSGIFRTVWDFDAGVIPSAEAIAAVQKNIGWSLVQRKENVVRFAHAGVQIDLGGFGKEYAADKVADVLQQKHQLHSGLVNLGGDIRVLGPKPNGEPWHMGIQDPRALDQLIATIPLYDGGLATSGDYERYFERDGKRYAHIIHPKTGYPVDCWRSISVLAPLAVVAGSISTIAMLQQQQAIAFLDAQNFAYLAIDQHGAIFQKQ